jgi:hypothetical protein
MSTEDSTEKVNFRVAGRLPRGQIRKPADMNEVGTNRPTIPSKLETILYKGDRETLGFGSKDLRFAANMESTPGPGQYGSGKGCVDDLQNNDSFGIKGTGSFASRSNRFPFARATGGPGPGAYRPVARPAASDPKVPSASFQKEVDLPIRIGNKRIAPGPGEYNVKLPDNRNCPGAATFRSRQKRIGNFGRDASATPGPGEYTKVRSGSAPAHTRDCRAAFAQPTKSAQSEVLPINPDLPAVRPEIDPTGTLARPRAPAAAKPGPGDYNVDVVLTEYTACVKGSSAFVEGNSHLPRRPKALTPGPGEYATKSSIGSAGGGRAAFADTQDRNRTVVASAAPGPAYYEQKPLEEKKSFHWNMRKKWV